MILSIEYRVGSLSTFSFPVGVVRVCAHRTLRLRTVEKYKRYEVIVCGLIRD